MLVQQQQTLKYYAMKIIQKSKVHLCNYITIAVIAIICTGDGFQAEPICSLREGELDGSGLYICG